jgi:hypothetical protein
MRPLGQYAPWLRWGGSDPSREPVSYRAWKALWQRLPSRTTPDLFDRIEETDWDLLVILDACRYDTLARVADNAAVERAVSPTTNTQVFLERAAERGCFEGATYVSANPQTDKRSPGDGIEVVKLYESEWDDALSTVPPAPVYDTAISRLERGDRVVAHTVQPHYPHVCEIGGVVRPVPGGLHPRGLPFATDDAMKMQTILSSGAMDLGRARRSYRAATVFAWRAASETAARLAADGYDVVVTADHGELFGEWGFVEHPVDVNLDGVLSVPWVEFSSSAVADEKAAIDKLEALGYVE